MSENNPTLASATSSSAVATLPAILVPDHLGFLAELDAAIENSAGVSLGVALVSFDCVTSIDSMLGYRAGDAFCTQVAAMLEHALKDGDRVFRVGRHELVCLLRRMPSETHAVLAAYKILRTLSTSVCIEGYYFDATPYVGIALSSQENNRADEISRQANIAMYEAKQKKDRFVVYQPKLEKLRLQQFQLQSDLRLAITNNELQVHFQPKVDLQTGVIVGVESLVRWFHANKGEIPPEDFIPLAESSGFMSGLTMRVMNLALSHYETLHAASAPLQIAINLSIKDLRENDFPTVVQSVLNVWNIPAQSVTFELTETAVMEDDGMYDESFERLKEMGVQLSIDDFGTGYSSMSRLHNLPVNELKIDMRFVQKMLAYASDEWIVQSMIKLAHDLGLKVVAEGVEDMATLRQLKEFGCDLVQGYCVSPPLDADAMVTFLAEWRGLPD